MKLRARTTMINAILLIGTVLWRSVTASSDVNSVPHDEIVGGSRRLALSEIPVVDLAPLLSAMDSQDDRESLSVMAKDIHYALSNIGFMYVKNHGVPKELIDDAMSASKSFFDLPLEAKRALAIEKSGEALHGYTELFGENTDASGRTRELKEIFDVGRMAKDGRTRPFFGPTPWPSPEFERVMMAYHDQMLSLARKLMVGLALSLDLPVDFFESMLQEPIGIQRMLHYPKYDATDVDDNVTGIGAHTDYGCLTILGQDNVGGLQVMNRDGKWIDAPPIPGTFVINIGDMIQRLTNDVYVANLHRFENTAGKDRYSAPFFFDVDYETVFEPLPNCVTKDRPAKYPPIVCGEHKWARYKASYAHLNTSTE